MGTAALAYSHATSQLASIASQSCVVLPIESDTKTRSEIHKRPTSEHDGVTSSTVVLCLF